MKRMLLVALITTASVAVLVSRPNIRSTVSTWKGTLGSLRPEAPSA